MFEDELLKWKLRRGSIEAMARVYEKYLDPMLTLAMGLLHDAHEAQDVVQDVFVSFVRCTDDFQVRGSLRAYPAMHGDLRPETGQPLAKCSCGTISWALAPYELPPVPCGVQGYFCRLVI